MMSLLVGLTLFVSLWHLMLQQQQQEQYIEVSSPYIITNESIIIASAAANHNHIETTFTTISEAGLEALPKNDFSQLIDLDNFKFTISHRGCRHLQPKPIVVILVHSAPENFQKRTVIRETWGRDDYRSLLIFLIGAVNTTKIQDKIELESNVHGDIVQGNFDDVYRNMTYKHVMALKWFTYNCRDAHYLLKTDDDVFVNTPLMYNYLEKPSALSQPFHRGRLLFCHEISRAKVKRTFRSKWRVSYDEYPEKYFPNHCPGFSILYSADIVPLLYQQAQKLRYFWIDDVQITGIVTSKLNISIAHSGNFFLNVSQQVKVFDRQNREAKSLQFFFALPNLSEHSIRELSEICDLNFKSSNVTQSYVSDNEVENVSNWNRSFKAIFCAESKRIERVSSKIC